MESQHSLVRPIVIQPTISMVVGQFENPNKSQFSFSGSQRQAPGLSIGIGSGAQSIQNSSQNHPAKYLPASKALLLGSVMMKQIIYSHNKLKGNFFQTPDVNGCLYTFDERLRNGNIGLFFFLASNNNKKYSINGNCSYLPSTI